MKIFFGIKKPYRVTSLLVLVLTIIFIFIILFQLSRIREREELEMTYHYVNFQHKLSGYMAQNISLINGLNAYLALTKYEPNSEIYIYLDSLLHDRLDQIRNVGIIKDTTIIWNFPEAENKDAIGVDLGKIENQVKYIDFVKENLKPIFQGPVNLVQGGMGYILRVPIINQDNYWGMVSIVLRGEYFVSTLDEYSNESDIDILIQDTNNNNEVVYGQASLFNKDYLTFRSVDFYGDWLISVKHRSPVTQSQYIWLLFILLIYLFVCYLVVRRTFSHLSNFQSTFEANEALNQQVRKDGLTGIFTRGYFIDRVLDEVKNYNGKESKIAFVFCDIDHFKDVNDQYGHEVGDQVLLEIAEILSGTIRKSDMITRWGGEEFLIMLSNISLEDAEIVTEKMRKTIEMKPLNKVGQITLSFGIAMYQSNEFVGSCIKRADMAMYRAKKNGRNQVVVDDELDLKVKNYPKAIWLEKWTCQHKLIDQEHKDLIESINDIVELSFFKEKKEVLHEKLDKIFQDVKIHFNDEEEILKAIEWEGLTNHRRIHGLILEAILKLSEDFRTHDISTEIFTERLLNAVIGHMEDEDSKFFESVIQSKSKSNIN